MSEAASPPPVESGQAGASARREYDRRVAKREADIEQRWGRRFGRVVRAITVEPQSTRAWGIGAWGEEQLGIALANVPGIRALHDRRVRGTRGTSTTWSSRPQACSWSTPSNIRD